MCQKYNVGKIIYNFDKGTFLIISRNNNVLKLLDLSDNKNVIDYIVSSKTPNEYTILRMVDKLEFNRLIFNYKMLTKTL